MQIKAQKGNTLIELLFTILVVGILFAFAAPTFQKLLDKQRQSSLINQLHAAIHFGRSHAISVGISTSLCAGVNRCGQSNAWTSQLLIFHDINQNGQIDSNEILLSQFYLLNGYTWHWSSFRNQPYISFKTDGTTHSSNGTFTLCRGDQALSSIVVSITGRARLQAPTPSSRCG